MTAAEAAILLNMIPEIGPMRFKYLKNHFEKLDDIFSAAARELQAVNEISENLARTILSFGNEKAKVEKELILAKEHSVSIVTIEDLLYPAFLKSMNDPPPVLYCKGELSCLSDPSVSLVGTRRPTFYGERIAAQLARELVESEMITVSGLARGIDTIVHKSTILAKGKTVAILGAGLLKLYPPENKKLAQSIVENGLLVSEFPLQFPPEPGHFPRRNRIIAGLSLGTVVIEADEKSGALITAQFAAEQGKDVFAVPGPVTSKMSRGPHKLLRQGAKLVESSLDILEELEPLRQRFFPHFKKIELKKGATQKQETAVSLSSQEQQLLKFIDIEPVHIDMLSSKTNFSSGELSSALLNLEMKGTVKALAGKMYVRN